MKLEINKQRGKWLTYTLIILFLTHLYALYIYIQPSYVLANKIYVLYPEWFKIYTVIQQVLALILIIGIWYWKKIFVYSSVILYLISIILGQVVVNIYAIKHASILISIVLIILLGYLGFYPIFRKWKYFN